MLNFENCDKMLFDGAGPYQIPALRPENSLRIDKLEWIPFNYARTAKDRAGKGVHFYVDDYQFARVWNSPDAYIPMLQQFAAVTSPDFSQYTDMPVAMQMEYRTADTDGMPDKTKEFYQRMKRRYALQAAGAAHRRQMTVEAHDAAFLARLRRS